MVLVRGVFKIFFFDCFSFGFWFFGYGLGVWIGLMFFLLIGGGLNELNFCGFFLFFVRGGCFVYGLFIFLGLNGEYIGFLNFIGVILGVLV